jgi:hypothetical protein
VALQQRVYKNWKKTTTEKLRETHPLDGICSHIIAEGKILKFVVREKRKGESVRSTIPTKVGTFLNNKSNINMNNNNA